MIIELIQLQLQLLVAAHSQHQHEQKIRNAEPTRMWQLPLIQSRHRFKKGAYHNLFADFRNGTNPEYCHHDYFRMSKYTFDYIVDKIDHR